MVKPFIPKWVDVANSKDIITGDEHTYVSPYEKLIAETKQQQRLILILFCTDEDKADVLKSFKITNASQAVKKLVYVRVTLTEAKAKEVPKLIRRYRPGQAKADLSSDVNLAAYYKVKPFPQIVFCDWYGNVLSNTKPGDFKKKADFLIKETLKQQADLEKSLAKQFKSAEKRYETEKAKGEFARATIAKLAKIAARNGYEPTEKASGYLDEINQVGEEEFNKICEKIDSSDKQTIIKELINLQRQYKYLPVVEKAQEKINELNEVEPIESPKAEK